MKMVDIYVLLSVFCCVNSPVCCISPAAINIITKSIHKAIEATSHMYTLLDKGDNITPEDAVVAYISVIPVIGDVMKLINGDVQNTEVDEILSKLDKISDQQETLLENLRGLHKKIDFIDVKVQITHSRVKIDSCSQERTEFLRDPKDPRRMEILLECPDKIMSDIRFFSAVLKEEDYTQNVFQDIIINSDGYCNATKIKDTFEYLLNILLRGCESVILAEQIEFNGTSAINKDECERMFAEAYSHLYNSTFKRCINDECRDITRIVENEIKSDDSRPVDQLKQDLSALFPWFTFAVFEFSAEENMKLGGNRPPGYFVYKNITNQFSVLWTPFYTRGSLENAQFWFNLDFKTDNYVNSSIGMNGARNFDTQPGSFLSYIIDDKSVSVKSCDNREATCNSDTIHSSILNILILFGIYMWVKGIF